MKKLLAQLEIAFWDTAISLMSQEKTPRVYSHTLAAMTLCLKPEFQRIPWLHPRRNSNISSRQWIQLSIIAMIGFFLGLVIGWLQSN